MLRRLNIYNKFNLSYQNTKIIKKYSQDTSIIKKVRAYAPYNKVYIDGCHDIEVVKSDVNNYKKMVSANGIIVVDDASCYMQLPEFVYITRPKLLNFSLPLKKIKIFKDFEDVSIASKNI